MHLLTEDYETFADTRSDDVDLLNKDGQLKYEAQLQLDFYMDQMINVNDEIIYFMKQGMVH